MNVCACVFISVAPRRQRQTDGADGAETTQNVEKHLWYNSGKETHTHTKAGSWFNPELGFLSAVDVATLPAASPPSWLQTISTRDHHTVPGIGFGSSLPKIFPPGTLLLNNTLLSFWNVCPGKRWSNNKPTKLATQCGSVTLKTVTKKKKNNHHLFKHKLLGQVKYLRVVRQVDLSRNVVNGADPLEEENVINLKVENSC